MGLVKIIIIICVFVIFNNNVTAQDDKKYYVEAFSQNGEPNTLVLKIKPVDANERFKILENKPRQDEEDDDPITSTTEDIPSYIPGLSKIFSGLASGNLNEIIYGGSSFASKNLSLAIDSAYNNAAGLPPPTISTSQAPPILILDSKNTTTTAPIVEITTVEEEEDGEDENENIVL